METLIKEKIISKKHFSTPILYGQQFEHIDVEKGIIRGVHVCCEGEIKGRGVRANKDFIRDVTKLGNEQTMGVKSRFGHPNMSNTTLGSFVGRFHNFRNSFIERDNGDKALASIADLHLDEAAKISPTGNLYDYTLELADSSPDMFGSSIAFMAGTSMFKKEKTGAKDEDGKDVYEDVEYATIKSLLATDLVDDGAATDRLFSSDTFAEQVTQYLDNNPEIYDILINQPEIVDNFILNYKAYKSNIEKLNLIKKQPIMSETKIEIKDENTFMDGLVNKIKGLFPKAEESKLETIEDDPKIAETKGKLDTANAEILTLKDELQTSKQETETLKSDNESLKTGNQTYKSDNESFKAENARIKTENTKILSGELIPVKDQDESEIGKLSDFDKSIRKDMAKLAETARTGK